MARPRTFDSDEVLDKAMQVFWHLGYDGASMAELTKAMDLNSTSIYAAYGSKRKLFDAVLDRYDSRRLSNISEKILSAGSAQEVAERALYSIAEGMVAPGKPLGCLLLQSGVSTGTSTDVPRELARRRKMVETMFRERFELAKASGDLDHDSDPASLALFISTIWDGIGIQAAAGATHEQLREVARRALIGWNAQSEAFDRVAGAKPEVAPCEALGTTRGTR
jgi:AcrR family transcriptional regulator